MSSSPLVNKAVNFFGEIDCWYIDTKRFVIIEKFESNIKIGAFERPNLDIEYIRFINKDGENHRNNENPSFISRDTVMWHKNGKLHRRNGKPAILRNKTKNDPWNFFDGENHNNIGNSLEGFPKEEYFINGVRHRDFDLPAVVFNHTLEHKIWFNNGLIHRQKDKPAIINGNFLFYFNEGKLYKSRLDYGNKIINLIVENPFWVVGTIFSILLSVIFFLS